MPPPAAQKYEQFKEQQAEISRERSQSGREIGPLPEVVNPVRKKRALASLRVYCETYKKAKFYLAWSDDQLTAIARLEECVVRGGHYAEAMTRGGGKTELCKAAIEWAILGGHRRFAMLVGATDPDAGRLMKDIKATFETNDLLLEDFPEVCYPVRRLEGINNRANGQTLNGKRTRIEWKENEIRLPWVKGAVTAGAVIFTRGITGAIRGASVAAPGGGTWRPDLVLIDDAQTRDSAKSFTQTNDRELIVDGDCLELAGPDTQIAAFMACTVIYRDDLSDRYLDRNKHGSWRGDRFKAIYQMPTNMKLWEEYAAIRSDSFRAGRDGSEATEFYVANREAMDEGAKVAWPARVKKGDVSALQTVMNVYFDKPRTFAAEWQNEPEQQADLTEVRQLVEADLTAKLNNLVRGLVPRECNRLTAFIDIQQEVLFWAVCGWTEQFGGAVVEYGAFPKQSLEVFTAANPPKGLSEEFPMLEARARIYAGLNALVPSILNRVYKQDGADTGLSVSLGLIDAGWETETIHDFISRCPLRPILKPSKGKGVGAAAKPMNHYKKNPGDLMGHNWRIDAHPHGKGRFVSFDTNAWKSFVAEAILAPPGSQGALYLPGKSISEHPLLSNHLLAEYRIPTFGQGRRVEEWRLRPDQRENHWWDGLVGCAVAASVLGVKFSAAVSAGATPAPEPVRKRVKWSEQYQQKHPGTKEP